MDLSQEAEAELQSTVDQFSALVEARRDLSVVITPMIARKNELDAEGVGAAKLENKLRVRLSARRRGGTSG